MFIIPLSIGALSLMFPFISIILLMYFCGKQNIQCVNAPFKTLLPVILIPLILLLFPNRQSTLLPVSDAIYGVGLVIFVFWSGVSRRLSLNNAFMTAVIFIVLYGIWRIHLYGSQLEKSLLQAVSEMKRLMPEYSSTREFSISISVMEFLMPAAWIVSQILALFIGLIVFQKQIKIPFRISYFTVSKYYGLMLLAISPLYFYDLAIPTLINAMLGMSVLLFLQGLGVLVYKGSQLVTNRLLLTMLLIILVTNAISYIITVLIGFADQWLNIRNINYMEEIPNESHTT